MYDTKTEINWRSILVYDHEAPQGNLNELEILIEDLDYMQRDLKNIHDVVRGDKIMLNVMRQMM